jgi:hypothetical protein
MRDPARDSHYARALPDWCIHFDIDPDDRGDLDALLAGTELQQMR